MSATLAASCWRLLLALALAAGVSGENVFTQGTSATLPGFLEQARVSLGLDSRAGAAARIPGWVSLQSGLPGPDIGTKETQPSWNDSFDANLTLPLIPEEDSITTAAAGDLSLARAASVNLAGMYPRYPRNVVPLPDTWDFCPSSMNVRNFGARGDGWNNDAGAISNANSALNRLYFPPGNYRISSPLTISKPLYAGMGAFFNIDQGVTLTITAQPQFWNFESALFGGAGRVIFKGDVRKINPDWFRTSWAPEADSASLQAATEACFGACTIMVTRNYWVTRPWLLRAKVGVFSTAGLLGDSGAGRGVVLRPGRYSLPLMFATMRNFRDYAIRVLGGATDAEIQVHTFSGANNMGSDGIVFSPQAGKNSAIRNVRLSHLAHSVYIQNTVVIEGTKQRQLLQNCLVNGGFVLLGGAGLLNQPSATVLVRGPVAPRLLNTAVIFQSWDPYQDIYKSRHQLLQSTAGNAAVGLKFQVQGWAGGLSRDGTSGRLFSGKFDQLQASFHMAHGVWWPWSQFGNAVGRGNEVNLGQMSHPVGDENTIQTANVEGYIYQGTAFFVKAPVLGNWPAGEVRTYYLDSLYAPVAGLRLCCLSKAAPLPLNDGVVCAGFVAVPFSAGKFRLAVRLRNSSGRELSQGAFPDGVRFGIQAGP